MKCPACGSDGCSGAHYDYAFRGMATDFNCDADDKHHFLIIELPPTEYEDAEEWMMKEDSCEEGALGESVDKPENIRDRIIERDYEILKAMNEGKQSHESQP